MHTWSIVTCVLLGLLILADIRCLIKEIDVQIQHAQGTFLRLGAYMLCIVHCALCGIACWSRLLLSTYSKN